MLDFNISIFKSEELAPYDCGEYLPKAEHPILTSDARSLFWGTVGWSWFVADTEGYSDCDSNWEIEIDSCGPFPKWMDCERDVYSWKEILFGHNEDIATQLIKLGIAPGQPFKIEFTYSCGEE